MQKYTYSIIIPHKNIPNLLQRCLDSIPQRDDVQVIIVDDNSDIDKVDFFQFPGLNRPNTEVYFDKTGRGAGRARNVGLEHAQGKWLIFADADDFFTEDLGDILNEYVDASEDIIYFKCRSVKSDNIHEPSYRNHWYDYLYEKYNETGCEQYMRCEHVTPWCKFIKNKLIKHYKIRFDEVRFSNDTFFVVSAGCYARAIYVSEKYLYTVTTREGSLTSSKTHYLEELDIRSTVYLRTSLFLKKMGYDKDCKFANSYMKRIFLADSKLFWNKLDEINSLKLEKNIYIKNIWNDFGKKIKLRLLFLILGYYVMHPFEKK